MPEERVELSRGCPRGILSPLRLPFRHSGVIAGPQLSAGGEPVEGALDTCFRIVAETLRDDGGEMAVRGLCRVRIMVGRFIPPR